MDLSSAFITRKSGLEPLLDGLLAEIHIEFLAGIEPGTFG